MKLLLLENLFDDLKKSRFPLGDFFASNGFEVEYACPCPEIKAVHDIPMSRNSLSLITILIGLRKLYRLENELESEIILSFRFMANVLNYLNSLFRPDKKRVAVITGLGYAFNFHSNSLKSKLQKNLITVFYKMASRRLTLVAQNPDDLLDLGIKNGNVVLGSGVSGNVVNRTIDQDTLRLLYVGRLLKSKGILKAKAILKELKILRPDATLTIAGTIDDQNPDNLTSEEFRDLIETPGVEYLGFVEDMDKVYASCNVLLFPSKYREGVPRVIIESLRYGLSVVTYNMPGCKETVGGNGFLINDGDPMKEIVGFLAKLTKNNLLSNSINSHKLFKSVFSSRVIYPQYMELLR